jgi:hypothetical protein
MKKITLALFMLLWLTSCGLATPVPIVNATLGREFTLAPDQTATITDTNLTIRLIGVDGDQRCPSEIECAISGLVSLSLAVQLGAAEPTEIDLQVFTSDDGSVSDVHFEGIEDRATYADYLIRVVGVLPYPAKSFDEIKDSKYRVSLLVSNK